MCVCVCVCVCRVVLSISARGAAGCIVGGGFIHSLVQFDRVNVSPGVKR